MFLVSVSKGPTHLVNVLHCGSEMVTCIPGYNPPLSVMLSLTLGTINRSTLRGAIQCIMYIDSFIVLVRFWSSLLTLLKLSTVVVSHMMLQWSYMGGGPEMFFEPLSKGSWRFTNILFITFHSVTLVLTNHPTFLKDGIFVFGNHQAFFMLTTPLKYTCVLCFVHAFLDFNSGLLSMAQLQCIFCFCWRIVWYSSVDYNYCWLCGCVCWLYDIL